MRSNFLRLSLVVCCAATPLAVHAQWNGQQAPRRQLGVEVQNTNTGVKLLNVLPGSPAAAQGLSPGDFVLAVGGQQVGYVDGRLIDAGDEINEHVNSAGQVTLLVLTARGELRTGQLNVAAVAGGGIQGTVLFQGSTRVSSQAVMNVRMIDTSYSQLAGSPVAQATVIRPDRNPLTFQLNYNPAQIYSDHRYAIEAEVVDSGLVVYRTDRPVAIDPASGRVALTLNATNSGNSSGWSQPATSYDQVTQWYQQYLGRNPTQQELYSWTNHINRGQPASDIQAYLLSSSEYYDRYQNNPNLYLNGVYQSLNGTDPNAQQMALWRQQYDQSNGMRSQFVRQMMQPPR